MEIFSPKSFTPLNYFPNELLQIIFSNLGPCDICSVSVVCKAFNKSALSEKIWKQFCPPAWESHYDYAHITSWKQKYMKWIRAQITSWKAAKIRKAPPPNISDSPKFDFESPNPTENETPYFYKAVMLGDTGVGKSSTHSRMTHGYFETPTTNIGIEFGMKHLTVDGNYVKLQIWDTAGQERYRSITRTYYRGATGFLLMYDITNRSTFENVPKWFNEIKSNCSQEYSVVIIGNKIDLKDRKVSTEEGKQLAGILGAPFIEVSARDNVNMKEILQLLVLRIFGLYKSGFYWIHLDNMPPVVPNLLDVERMIEWSEESRRQREGRASNWRISQQCCIS